LQEQLNLKYAALDAFKVTSEFATRLYFEQPGFQPGQIAALWNSAAGSGDQRHNFQRADEKRND